MGMLERIQKVIVSGMLGLGLSVMMTVPSVAELSAADRQFIEDTIKKLVQPQLDRLDTRLRVLESGRPVPPSPPGSHRPPPASHPKRVIHIHRHYYRYYWCPPPWW